MSSLRKSLGAMPTSNFFSFQDIIMSVTGILIVVALMLALEIDKATTPMPAIGGIAATTDPAEKLAELERMVERLKAELQALQTASRGVESQPELVARTARIEERISSLAARAREDQPSPVGPVPNSEELRNRAIEITRLRGQIRDELSGFEQSSSSLASSGRTLSELEQRVRETEAAVIAARGKASKLALIREASDTSKEPLIADVSGGSIRILRFGNDEVIDAGSSEDFADAVKRFSPENHFFVLFFRPEGAPRFDELRSIVKGAGFEIGYDAIPSDMQLNIRGGPPE